MPRTHFQVHSIRPSNRTQHHQIKGFLGEQIEGLAAVSNVSGPRLVNMTCISAEAEICGSKNRALLDGVASTTASPFSNDRQKPNVSELVGRFPAIARGQIRNCRNCVGRLQTGRPKNGAIIANGERPRSISG